MSRILSSGVGVVAGRGFGLLLAVVCGIGIMTAQQGANTLTAAEKADGWKLLFDGKTTTGLARVQVATPPRRMASDRWRAGSSGQGRRPDDREQFDNFELRLEWKVAKNGNSGIMYRVTEQGDADLRDRS